MSIESTETKATSERMCEKHGTYTETVTTTFSYGGQPFVRTTRCPACEQEREGRRKRQAEEAVEERRQWRIASNRESAHIPARFAAASFECYIAINAGQVRALSVVRAFAEQFESIDKTGCSLTLCGSPGCGKTHLACAIANHVIDSGRTAIYTQAIELIRAIRETWRDHSKSEAEVIDRYRSTGLLIVDEIGVQFGSEAERAQLFDVLDGRYREMRPTLIVSNLNSKGLQECLGARIYDRLMQNGSTCVAFNWKSYRPEAVLPRLGQIQGIEGRIQ